MELSVVGPSDCSVGNGGCDQLCTDSFSGPTCGCLAGYTLNADGRTCEG